ncbi:MAG: hypothetical protein GY719_04065 [bacterium]|nr:hypothetical protein [bacterium]
MTRPYSVFLHLEVTEALRFLDRSERASILQFSHALAANPFQPGDFREEDDQGRVNEVQIIGRQAVVYYVDDADSEVRILEVRPVDR